jgi:pilus assembly protein CpaE
MQALLIAPRADSPAVGVLQTLLRGRGDRTEVATPDRAEAEFHQTGADLAVVLVAPDEPDRTLDGIRRLRRAGVRHLLTVGPATDPKLILKTLQVGSDLFLDEAELNEELDAALARLVGRDRDARPEADRPPTARRPRQLLAVVGAGGGCGASTVAVNLAAAFAREHAAAHLIDLNLTRGDLAPLLDVTPPYTLADLAANENRLDRALYEKLLARHPSGVTLLAAPRELADADLIPAACVNLALDIAQELYSEVVVDLEGCHRPEHVTVLDRATTVFLVCRLSFTSVRSTRRLIDHLRGLGVHSPRVRVVVNQFGSPDELPIEEAEESLGLPLADRIPYDPANVRPAGDAGQPVALRNPTAKATQGIAKLVGLEWKDATKSSGLVPMLKAMFRSTAAT